MCGEEWMKVVKRCRFPVTVIKQISSGERKVQYDEYKVKAKSLSRVWLFTTPWTAAYQAPPSMGFSRQECWSGLPLPSPSAYLRLLIFLPAILIPVCASSSPAFLMMYFAYKLNKQGDYIQPWCTPFPIWNQSVVPCPVLTVASWPAYRFLKRQVRWSGISISLRIFQFMMIHTIKGFGIVN